MTVLSRLQRCKILFSELNRGIMAAIFGFVAFASV